MSPVAYDLVSDRESSPFDDFSPRESSLTFRVNSSTGRRYDRPITYSGMTGQINWLWQGRIPFGRVTLIEGPAGAGKSFVALDLAARVADDRPWPDGTPQPHAGSKALIICRQDDLADVVGARLEAMGTFPQRCLQVHEFETLDEHDNCNIRPLSLPFDLPALNHILGRDPSIRLVVIDSLSDVCAGKHELAEVLHQLNRLASEHRVAVVATLRAEVRFDRLAQVVTKSPFDTSAARCRWCCIADPEDRTKRLFLPTQMNYAELPTGLAFRPAHLRIDWLEGAIDPHDPIRKLSDCGQWLSDVLAGEAEHSKAVIQLGNEYGFSEGQVRRAFREIGASKNREGCKTGSKVMWSLKDKCGIRSAECGIKEAGREWAPNQTESVQPASSPANDSLSENSPFAANGEMRQDVAKPLAEASPVAIADRANVSRPVAPVAAAAPGRILRVEELPWADSPSNRLAPLTKLLDLPNNPRQLLRNVKSMPSMQSTAK